MLQCLSLLCMTGMSCTDITEDLLTSSKRAETRVHVYSPEFWLKHRKWGLRPDMTEELLTGT